MHAKIRPMLSYQHEYHAGNFADVHKHLCLRVLFEALLQERQAILLYRLSRGVVATTSVAPRRAKLRSTPAA